MREEFLGGSGVALCTLTTSFFTQAITSLSHFNLSPASPLSLAAQRSPLPPTPQLMAPAHLHGDVAVCNTLWLFSATQLWIFGEPKVHGTVPLHANKRGLCRLERRSCQLQNVVYKHKYSPKTSKHPTYTHALKQNTVIRKHTHARPKSKMQIK